MERISGTLQQSKFFQVCLKKFQKINRQFFVILGPTFVTFGTIISMIQRPNKAQIPYILLKHKSKNLEKKLTLSTVRFRH